jgi:WD40 repeat protein
MTPTASSGPTAGDADATDSVQAVAVGELDGRPVAVSGAYDGTVRVWDLARGSPVGQPLTGHTSEVRAVAVGTLDGRPIAVSGDNHRTVRVWDLARGTPVGQPLTGHTSWVNAAAVGELDGRPIAVTGDDSTVLVWELSDRRLTTTIAFGAPIYALAFVERRGVVIGTSRGLMLLELAPAWRPASDTAC